MLRQNKAPPIVEVHGGGEGVVGVHDRADATGKEGHSVRLSAVLLAQLLGGPCGRSVGFGGHAAIHHRHIHASLLPHIAALHNTDTHDAVNDDMHCRLARTYVCRGVATHILGLGLGEGG